jgi:excisionase family DNA binding protein
MCSFEVVQIAEPLAYTVEQFAELLQYSEDTIYRAVKDGKIPSICLSRGTKRPRGIRIPAYVLKDLPAILADLKGGQK